MGLCEHEQTIAKKKIKCKQNIETGFARTGQSETRQFLPLFSLTGKNLPNGISVSVVNRGSAKK